MIKILKSGPGTRLVDGIGQRRRAHLGVSIGGAADRDSLAHANSLVNNPVNAQGLEMTLLGPTLTFTEPTTIALSGAQFKATLNDIAINFYEPVDVNPGDILKVQSGPTGIRAYLAYRDPRLPFTHSQVAQPLIGDGHLRVTMGHAFHEPLLKAEYKASPHTNRQAIFLDGPAIEAPAGNMITEGVPLGGIQLPPSGQPMILFVDQQTTGGYPIIACVIHRDIPKLGQLRPQQPVSFTYVAFDEAEVLNRS
jgi:allophanate hydrolase subunit 2